MFLENTDFLTMFNKLSPFLWLGSMITTVKDCSRAPPDWIRALLLPDTEQLQRTKTVPTRNSSIQIIYRIALVTDNTAANHLFSKTKLRQTL